MASAKNISIEPIRGTINDYIIKDNIGITIGRFYIQEMDAQNRNCTLRIKFYRENRGDLLKESLNLILPTIFKNKDVYKINILISEDVNLTPFSELGFSLEGILEDNILCKGDIKSEFIFGINRDVFRNENAVSVFVIRGRNIHLRLLTPENHEDVLNYYIKNRDHLKKFEPLRDESFYTEEVQKNILRDSYRQYLNGSSLNLGIYKDGDFIGKIQLSNVVQGVFKNAFLGYSLDKDYQGKGYMKEAVEMVVDYAFNEMELHRIEASTLVDNLRSQGVLKACGFKELGINKEYLYINGGWRDHITFYRCQ